MSEKLYPIVKRVSLAGLSDGWDDSCYAYVVPSNYADQKELTQAKLDKLDPAAQVDYQLKFVRDHFVSGKIKVFDGAQFVEADMTADHTAASVDLTDLLYSEIMGLGLDPKDIRKVAVESALQKSDEAPTEITSSETSLMDSLETT